MVDSPIRDRAALGVCTGAVGHPLHQMVHPWQRALIAD